MFCFRTTAEAVEVVREPQVAAVVVRVEAVVRRPVAAA